VWGDDHFFNSRNLDVYITKLRDYFKEDQEIKIITIKGWGIISRPDYLLHIFSTHRHIENIVFE